MFRLSKEFFFSLSCSEIAISFELGQIHSRFNSTQLSDVSVLETFSGWSVRQKMGSLERSQSDDRTAEVYLDWNPDQHSLCKGEEKRFAGFLKPSKIAGKDVLKS